MKNVNLLKLAKVLMMLPMLVFLVNCSKSSKNDANRGYGYGNNGYYMYNGQCLSPQGQPAPMQYCQNGGIGNPGYGQACDGIYLGYYNQNPQQRDWTIPNGQQMIQVQCFAQTRNCAGYTLFNQQQQPVHCQ